MSLLFMFPSSVIVPQLGILVFFSFSFFFSLLFLFFSLSLFSFIKLRCQTKGEIQPVLEMNYHRFFFLNYERLKLSVFSFLF